MENEHGSRVRMHRVDADQPSMSEEQVEAKLKQFRVHFGSYLEDRDKQYAPEKEIVMTRERLQGLLRRCSAAVALLEPDVKRRDDSRSYYARVLEESAQKPLQVVAWDCDLAVMQLIAHLSVEIAEAELKHSMEEGWPDFKPKA